MVAVTSLLQPGARRKFESWLRDAGAEILAPAYEWELLKFRAGTDIGIVYRNARGRINLQSAAHAAWQAYTSGQPWRASPKIRRRARLSDVVATLLERDGSLCFYCRNELGDDDMTVEHLVSVTCGGPNHISNLFLTHKKCNEQAGNLSAPEKIRMHVEAIIRRGR
jgi:5-methylcytosine-specific restriction endonuclease McrA